MSRLDSPALNARVVPIDTGSPPFHIVDAIRCGAAVGAAPSGPLLGVVFDPADPVHADLLEALYPAAD